MERELGVKLVNEKKTPVFLTGMLAMVLIVAYTFTLKNYEPATNIIITGGIVVYPLTFLMGEEIKYTRGEISAKSGFQGDIRTYQISVPITNGNSGGPLFDNKGNIVGIVSAKHLGAENVGYAIKISYLKPLVDSVTSLNILPQLSRISAQNLSGKVKAVKNFIYCIICSTE